MFEKGLRNAARRITASGMYRTGTPSALVPPCSPGTVVLSVDNLPRVPVALRLLLGEEFPSGRWPSPWAEFPAAGLCWSPLRPAPMSLPELQHACSRDRIVLFFIFILFLKLLLTTLRRGCFGVNQWSNFQTAQEGSSDPVLFPDCAENALFYWDYAELWDVRV